MRQSTSLFLFACIALGLGACASRPGNSALPGAQRAVVDGRTYELGPLTAGTWTATGISGQADTLDRDHQQAVVQAIEKASGCKVTDSNFSENGNQLDAQIACANTTPD